MISQKTISELISKYELNTAFHKIRNLEYLKPIPENAKLGYKTIEYAGYTINVPALVIENKYEI